MLRALLLILGLCISSTGTAGAPVSRDDPESADPGQAAISNAAGNAVVVTANPRASRAANRVSKDARRAHLSTIPMLAVWLLWYSAR